jgi:D-alanine-D-alanine ligase
MSAERLRVGVVFGGISAEHEVSWVSARNVIRVMDRDRYLPVPVLIDQDGYWYRVECERLDSFTLQESGGPGPVPPEQRILLDPEDGKIRLLDRATGREQDVLDLIFPLVHGTCGEDGTLQGLCKMYQVPFVGPGVAASAACMDKEIMKRILLGRGIPVSDYISLVEEDAAAADHEGIVERLGLPLFVKPANLGSSVGITKAKSLEELKQAIAYAFRFDEKIVIEENVQGREIECSVLGNKTPEASVPGEIVPRHEFYSYQAKYQDPEGAELKIPADLDPESAEKVRELALKSFTAMECEGMARVDFFLRPDGSVLINELNTIPGFTDISMYPKLWEASGVPCGELVHRLIQLGLERYRREIGKSHDRDGTQSPLQPLP